MAAITPGSGSTSASDNSIAVNNLGNNSPVTIIQQLATLPSVLNPLLDQIISKHQPLFEETNQVFTSPETEVKITHNAVKVYANEIRENSGYMSLIEGILDAMDDENPDAKNIFLWAINKKYTNYRKQLFIDNNVDPANKIKVKELICRHADKIIARVAQDIKATANGDPSSAVELVESAIDLVVCYGFINCQILEEPE